MHSYESVATLQKEYANAGDTTKQSLAEDRSACLAINKQIHHADSAQGRT